MPSDIAVAVFGDQPEMRYAPYLHSGWRRAISAGAPGLRHAHRGGIRRRRFSSYDRTGGNDDRFNIQPGETTTIAGPDAGGIITHIWATLACDSSNFLRKIVIRAYRDGEEHPSVESSIGDFFGTAHGQTRNYASLPMQASPG